MTLSRRTPLRSDPGRTRDWQDRCRVPLQTRAALSRDVPGVRDPQANARAALRTSKRKRRARIPAAVRARVFARSQGLCICGCGQRADHLHHVLRVERSEWAHLVTVEQIMVGMFHDCHWAHEFEPNARLPYERLPQVVVEYVRGLGPKAAGELERYHPR